MNIFYVNQDPMIAARELCDKHVVKMIVEGIQMMSTAHHVLVPTAKYLEDLYKPSHTNHPCNKWIRVSSSNYNWLYYHTEELSREYTRRYGKNHRSAEKLKLTWINPSPVGPETTPPQCMPDEFKVTDNPVQAYQNFYVHDKACLLYTSPSPRDS